MIGTAAVLVLECGCCGQPIHFTYLSASEECLSTALALHLQYGCMRR